MKISNQYELYLRALLPYGATVSNAASSDTNIATAEWNASLGAVTVRPNKDVTGIFDVSLFGQDNDGNDIFAVFRLHSTTQEPTQTYIELVP